jgi:nitroreductase
MTSAFLPYDPYSPDDPNAAVEVFKRRMKQRRSIRDFSTAEVPEPLIENLIETACSAPSGANKQPWHFVAVRNGELKAKIRQAAEREERRFYEERAPATWLKDLEELGTDANKPFLEDAPWLIVVFRRTQSDHAGQVYYSHESVGLACGLLLAAAQEAGLATLTHTPSPMRFLSQILDRPAHEKPFLLIPVGWPAPSAQVPQAATHRRPLCESLTFRR